MPPRFRVLLPVLLLALVALVGTRRSDALQSAEPRVALVIGNAAYAGRPLTSPVDDGRAMAAAVKQLGFAAVQAFGAGRQAGETRVNAKDGAVMVWVPAGEFDMGSRDGASDEKPVHRVRLTKGYWLYQTEVTNAMYSRFVRETGHRQPQYQDNARFNGAQQPVVGVDWDDAEAYARWAGGRLPTEAEWEYAARGPDGRKYPWGNREPTASLAVFNRPTNTGSAAAVGSKRAGASWCGALDLAGNVWEWCSDCYDDDYYQMSPRQDPENTINSPDQRVLRGGSWSDNWGWLRSAGRNRYTPDLRRLNRLGFRLARTIP